MKLRFSTTFFKFLNIQLINIFATILLGKYIAINFKPQFFGEYSLITGLLGLLSLFFLTPTIQSFRTSYFKDESLSIQGFYLNIISFFLLFVCTLSPLMFFFTNSLTLIILSVSIFAAQSYYSFFSAEINLQGRNNLYSYIQVSIPTFTLITLFVIAYFNVTKLETLLYGTLFGNLMALILSFYFAKPKITNYDFKKILNSKEVNELLNYIRPILFLPLFSWIVTSGDKYLIKIFLNDHSVGLYSASYSIGAKVFLSISGMLILWLNSSIFSEVNGNKRLTLELLNTTFKRIKIYLLFGLLIVLIIQLFSEQIGLLLLSPSYSEGFYLIGILSLAQLIFTSFQFLEQLVYAQGSTRFIIYHYAFGASINLILNIIFIPLLGILGSALAMIISTTSQLFFLKILISNQFKVKI